MDKFLPIFVISVSLLVLCPGTLANRNQTNRSANNVIPQSRDHDAGSYQVPPQQSSNSYAAPSPAPAPAKPDDDMDMDIHKFKFAAIIFVLCIMTLGVLWTLLRVSYYAELGAAGTTRSALQSFWDGLPKSILQDATLTELASKILQSDALDTIVDKILDSSK